MYHFQSKPESRPTFEDIFFKHYVRLNAWALQLTGGGRSDAEDLVQELYVRLAGVGPVGEHIESAEDYLFSVLRNLHYARIRRARTSAIDDLSIVDYDTVERSLRAVDRNGILFIREGLHRVCDYLCERKNTSRSASIFILRYFLGYFPHEVMKVVQATRVAVDKAVQAARREARLDLERPGVLQHIESGRESKPRVSKDLGDSNGIFLALRAKVFRSCTGECFNGDVLDAKYREPGQSFTTAELAHLISCPKCLDHANRLLGLPLLEERSPDETIGRDTPRGPDGPGDVMPTLVLSRAKKKANDLQRLRKRMKRGLEEVHQHRPQRLSIAVDGDIRASQRVTAQLSELRAELRPMEKPEFIEVLSEQGICLAFLPVQALSPEGGLQQIREIELSDRRAIRVAVSFTAEAPAIQVVYSDPLIGIEEEAAAVESYPVTVPKFAEIPNSLNPWKVAVGDLSARLRRWFAPSPIPQMNPLLTGATIFALCSLFCVVLWTRSGPGISARTLLSRAEQSDASTLKSGRSGVIYQKVRIASRGRTMERAIYRDPEQKGRPSEQQFGAEDQQMKDRLDRAGVNWDDPLSAANFSTWRDRQLVKRDVVRKTGNNLLTLTTSVMPGGAITEESLTVRESDFHSVARTVKLNGEGTVEIAELNYDVMPREAVNQDWFAPVGEMGASDMPSLHAAIHLPHVLSDYELNEAELTARTTLNQLHADTGEPIHLTRETSGIYVKGVVDTETRRQELVSRLAMFPNVHSSILSVEEIGTRSSSRPTFGREQPIHVYSVEARTSTLEQYLREKKLPLDQLGNISQKLLDHSLMIQQAEIHLAELQQRFKETSQLPVDQQNQLTGLSRSYINTIKTALDTNQSTLRSIGLDGIEQVSSPAESDSPVDDLNREVRRYQELCQQLITSGTGEPASAVVLANQLKNSDALIRASASRMSKSLSTAHN